MLAAHRARGPKRWSHFVSLSPDKGAADDAARYAVSKGVLLVHAAGNDGANLATEPNSRARSSPDGTCAEKCIEVGASS